METPQAPSGDPSAPAFTPDAPASSTAALTEEALRTAVADSLGFYGAVSGEYDSPGAGFDRFTMTGSYFTPPGASWEPMGVWAETESRKTMEGIMAGHLVPAAFAPPPLLRRSGGGGAKSAALAADNGGASGAKRVRVDVAEQ